MELKKIQEREKVCLTYRRIRRMEGNDKYSGISRINYVNEQNQLIELSDKKAVVEKIMEVNKKKFLQCSTTPFYEEPLSEYFDEACRSEYYDQILQGTFNFPVTTDRFSKMLLEKMTRHPSVKDVSPYVTTDRFIEEWLLSRENTSAGISGLTFSHMKSICSDYRQAASTMASLSGIALRTGYSYRRWRTSLNVMLLKEIGNFNVERLRTIQLYECCFNKNQKMMAGNTMNNAEKAHAISQEQIGSRKEHQVDYLGAIKCITLDIFR